MTKRIWIVLLAVMLGISAAGCAPQAQQGSQTPQGDDLEKVTVILDYVPNTNHTGLYVALEKGYYADAGLDVSIVQPTEGATATLIAAGKGDFGISYQEDVTYARTAADPLPIRAIAAVMQHNTSGFASYKDKNIQSPADFAGKVYAGWGSPAEEAVIRAVMERAGVDSSTLSIINFGDEGFFAAAPGPVDLAWIYYGWTGIEAEMKDFPINYLPLTELHPALDFYTPVIIASEETLANKADLTRAFLSATAKGYADAVADPAAAAAIFVKHAPEYELDYITRSQEWISPYYVADAEKWGVMDAARWDAYTQFMVDNGLIDTFMPADEGYTNEFLP